jgi:hypothetical protein
MRTNLMVCCAVAAAVMGGCVNYDERMELNVDGSGVVRMHLTISEQALPRALRTPTDKEADLLPAPREELTREIEADGFKVRSLAAESARGLRHIYLVIEFKRLEDVAKSELFGGRKVSLSRVGDKWQFRQLISLSEKSLTERAVREQKPKEPAPAVKGKAGEESGQYESIVKQLEARLGKEKVRQMISAYSISFSVSLNGAVLLRSNGRSHRDVASIWEIPLSQCIDDNRTVSMEAEFAVPEPSTTPPPSREDKP